MATTYNFTDGSITNQDVMTQTTLSENQPMILRHILDFSLQTIQAGASDVAQALIVPADTTVLSCWARVITAETADATIDLGYGSDADYFGGALNVDSTGIVSTILTGSATWDASSIDDHATANAIFEAKDVTVAGAALGDAVIAYPSIDVTDMTVNASVTAEDTVTVVMSNPTGAAINLGSMTIAVIVYKAPLQGVPLHFSAADTIDITATTDNGDVDLDALKVEVSALCIKQLDSY